MGELDFFPANILAMAGEHQNVNEIQTPNRSWCDEQTPFIVDPKCGGADAFSEADDLCGIWIIRHTAAEKQSVASACGAARDIAVLGIMTQEPKGRLLPLL